MKIEVQVVRDKKAMSWQGIVLLLACLVIGAPIWVGAGYDKVVFVSGIAVLILFLFIGINRYFLRFSLIVHYSLCLGILVAGIIFVLRTMSAIDKMNLH